MAIIKYTPDKNGNIIESVSNDGGKTYTNTGATSSNGYSGSAYSGGSISSGNNTSKYGYSSGNNNYAGKTGKTYDVAGSNGTIKVTYKDGTSRTVLPTDADYAVTQQAMQTDIKANGGSYTPNTTYTNQNGTYTSKSYTAGNSDLQYALQQAAKQSSTGSVSLNDYVESLYNRVGTQRADGSTVSLQNVTDELTRLGLSDYLPGNAIYTAGGTLLPGNEFGSYHDDNGQTSNSADSRWYSYGGRDYLVGGDSSNYANYVNALTGNYNNLDYIFGGVNMANNPYAQQNPEFLNQFNQQLASLYANAGVTGNTTGNTTGGTNGVYTGNANVDNVINYWNSMNNYGNASGGSANVGTSNLLELLQSYLDGGLEANKNFLEQQRALAQQNAEKAASDAYINQALQQDAAKQQLSALGLGTSGALQGAQLGIQGNYGNNLSEINSNLNTMLSSLSEQELQILSDYYNNMANYAYDVTQYEQDYALQQAQLALQQQQAIYDRQMAQQQLALQQQQWEWQQKQAAQEYADAQRQYQDETAYNKALQQGAQYESLYNAGLVSGTGLKDALTGLGLLGGTSNTGAVNNGIYTGYTQDQYNNQLAYLQNMIAAGTPGQQTWAQSELAKLNAQYGR